MQNPSPHATPDHGLFYDVDEAGNLVQRTLSTAAAGKGTRVFDYDAHGRLERVSQVLWTAPGEPRV